MNKLTLGSTYRNGYISTEAEIIPQKPAFMTYPEEEHVFEERDKNVSLYQVESAWESGMITKLDKKILSLVAVFGSAACTTKNIFELLTLMGEKVSRNLIESSVKRLHRYQLINFSRFKLPDGRQSNARVITLMRWGSQFAKSMGVHHRFNPHAAISAEAHTMKSRVAIPQLICSWLKNMPVEKFEVRPIKVVDADAGAIVRPAASIDIWGQTIYFEIPRRYDGWLTDLVDKMKRYELVFGKDNLPTIVINGEDTAMNLEIHRALKNVELKTEILFTDDLAMFGSNFKTSLYNFNSQDEKMKYIIENTEREAV